MWNVYIEWHLATQILYFIGAVLLLAAEIFARAQLCCDERKAVYWALASVVLASGELITLRCNQPTCSRLPDEHNLHSGPIKSKPQALNDVKLHM